MLFGKPLLRAFKAIHDYTDDTIRIPQAIGTEWVVLTNQFTNAQGTAGKLLANLTNLTVDIKQLIKIPQPTTLNKQTKEPMRKSEARIARNEKGTYNTYELRRGFTTPLEGSSANHPHVALAHHSPNIIDSSSNVDEKTQENLPDEDWNPVWLLNEADGTNLMHPGTEQPELMKVFEPSVLTRKTDPRSPERIAAIQAEITVGSDLTMAQAALIRQTIAEYADCFALSMSEVTPVEGAAHRLDIPRDTPFRTKVNQRPQTPPQREFFNGVLDKMLEAGIIRPIDYQDVKCCGATTLAKKAHEGSGRTLNTLKHQVNDECIAAGFPPAHQNLPPLEEADLSSSTPPAQNKWRVCQDFAELNRVTKVPPMPQGDIRQKQQNLSGHRWITVFDFANGFYACEIKPEDQPYICFYVEGRGYYAYLRMPFGLTGAPSSFGQMTAKALGDLIGTLLEMFVDDGGLAGDHFETMLANTIQLLQRVHEKGLSLSAAKCKFFVTEATFAGARVGPEGIKPDLTKLTAVADWKTPTDLQKLGSFLGLTGYFRSLIKGYASVAQPLTDLARNLELPKLKGKAAYTKAMKSVSLQGLWSKDHDRAFLRLKIALTSEPVLKGPKYDGTPFIVTTDSCKYGFAGMLTQKFTTVLPN